MPRVLRTIAGTGFAVLALAAPAGASTADPLAALKGSCAIRRSADRPPAPAARYRICTGTLSSFDGTPLDATVTLPATVSPRARLPLVVFLHGFLSSKKEYMSQTRQGIGADRGGDAYKTSDFNNVWFASRGYAVLNYTARGHDGSGGQIGLASKNVEVRDTHFLTGLLADDIGSARPLLRLDPRHVAAIGSSYGGGQTWLLLTTREDPRLQFGEWRSPRGRLVRLAAAVPQFTWTDLLYSLAPSGHHLSSGVDPARADHPFGVGKNTLLNGFLATAASKFTPEIVRWLTRFNAGEPYDAGDPIVEEARAALTRDRSAFYQDDYFAALRGGRQRRVPVLAAQGWTDPIFPAIESVRMYRRLRQVSPSYPISLYLGDFEHLSALVKIPDLRYYHGLANLMLDRYLKGSRRAVRFDVRSAISNCDAKRFGPIVQARTWDSLHPASWTVDLPGSQSTTSSTTDARGQEVDPVTRSLTKGRGCLTTRQPVAAGVATWTVPVARAFTLLGMPRLSLRFSTVAPDIELNSRLWDIASDGTETLVTRGAYRAVSPKPLGDSADYELFGNAWRFATGHRLRLEITQSDATYLRADNFGSSAAVSSVRLVLPGRR